MTSVQPGSTSSRWDNRNSGFISPAQLQQWKQAERGPDYEISQSARAASPATPPTPPPAAPEQQQQAQAGPSAAGHARLSSFSLFKSFVSPQQHSPPAPSTSDANSPQPQPSAPQPSRRMSEDIRSLRPAYTGSQLGPMNGNGMHTKSQSMAQPQIQSATAEPGDPPQGVLHPEIKSIVELTAAHAHKIYYSGPLLRHIERQPDGQRPSRDEGWRDVWAQLGGTTLSVWDMQAVDEASKQGKQVPPTYINITDSFVNVLEAMTFPAIDDQPPKRYTNVLTLNTAGSNLLLFSCPSREALLSWAAAIRLSAWEKSRLEEIYTAHLIRIILNDGRDAPSPLVNGRMEGWVRIRIAGQTDWKQMWMVVSAGGHSQDGSSVSSADPPPASPSLPRKKRMSHLFGRERSPPRPTRPVLIFYTSNKPKDRKKPALTLRELTQVFAVYPERPEWISRSTLMKLEGQLGDEEVAAGMKLRECWVLVMPEFEGGNSQASEMLKWLIAMHDAFELYGRPHQYSWNPRDPRSMMFAYPIGPQRDLLFLDRELAETLDVRDERTSSIRSRLQTILFERMRGPAPPPQIPPLRAEGPRVSSGPPTLPPLRDVDEPEEEPTERHEQRNEWPSMQLPPLNFETSNDSDPPAVPEKRALTPITERSGSRSLSAEHSLTQASTVHHSPPAPVRESSREVVPQVLDKPVTSSPTQATSPLEAEPIPLPAHIEEPTHGPIAPRPATAQSRPSVEATKSHSHRPSIGQAAPSQRSIPQSAQAPVSPSQSPRPISPRSTTSSSQQYPAGARVVSPRPSSPATALSSLYTMSSAPTTPTSPYTTNKTTLPGVPARPPAPSTPAPPPAPPKPPAKKQSEADDILGEAGALYYMRMQETGEQAPVPKRRQPPPPVSSSSESESESEYSLEQPPAMLPPRMRSTPPPPSPPPHAAIRPPASRRSTGASGSSLAAPSPEPGTAAGNASRSGHVRKPSGARALPGSKMPPFNSAFAQDASPREQRKHNDKQHAHRDMASADVQPPLSPPSQAVAMHPSFEEDADALAALTFLEQEDKPPAQENPTSPPQSPVPQVVETPASPSTRHREPAFRSSFMPSKAAAERKAKSQAQQAAHQAAVKRPGKANGKAKAKTGGWAESSDEEEEEEEEEEDDADSDTAPPPRPVSRSDQQSTGRSTTPSAVGRSAYGQQSGSNSPARSAVDVNATAAPQPRRPPRELPQLPQQRLPGDPEDVYAQRRLTSAPYSEAGRASFMEGPRRFPSPNSQMRPQSEYPHPSAARQTIWSQVLDPNRPQNAEANNRDTFVQLEDRTQAMTKAFTPHGLLSAGLQDREDRSAKRQEELARETGASLINVPNKPPPPQTGLLGAVTAHERERKREGGLGATLTEREREKRLAEERQRKLDEFQRQQLDQMQQGGSMYGGMGMPPMGFNPMMNPMMMGMNPMMTGGWFPGMMPGFPSPQMLAAQQAAAQAYQQAMMAFTGQGEGGAPQLNPMMTGGSMGMGGMGGMGGMDPRMSMMGIPMMSPGMGMMNPGLGMTPTGMSMNNTGMGMNPGMQMPPGMGMGGMSPGMGMNPGMNPGMGAGGMGMPSSGNFDSPSFDSNMRPFSTAHNTNSARQASPALGPRFANSNLTGEDSPRGSSGGAEPIS